MIGFGIFFVVFVVVVIVIIYYIIRSKYIENMVKIEYGIMEDDNNSNVFFLLNLGIFFCFLGGGFLLVYFIFNNSKVLEYVVMFICLFFLGGIGLIVSYFINFNF